MSSSFWQSSSPKTRPLKAKEPLNQSLPSLNSSLNLIKRRKQPCKTVHQSVSSPSKLKIIKNELVRLKGKIKKQTFVSIHCRSLYRLPTAKNKIDNSPSIEFSNIISKIQELFNEECNVSQDKQDVQFKFKKALTSKVTFGKLTQYQILLQTNSKKQAKRQFEDILRIYNRNLLKIPQIDLKREKPLLAKPQKTDWDTHLRKQTTFSLNNSNFDGTKSINEQNLTQWQKQQFFKQTKAFQKADKHLTLKTFTVKLFYHHLTAQLALELSLLQDGLTNLYFCEYYARKIDLQVYIVPCLVLQSEIKQSLYEFDDAISILKTALQFSIVKKWRQMEMRILEKISIIYYYKGNSYVAKYYKQLSQNGLPKKQADIYIKQYSKTQELKSLQARLFSFPFDGIKKKKNNEKYELDINRDLLNNHQKIIIGHHQDVSQMLRSNKTSKIGIKIRKMILQNSEKADVKIYSPEKHTSKVLPRFAPFQFPLEHCSQIIKSHLSKDRYSLGSQIKSVSFLKTLSFMKSLYSRLCYQLTNEKFLQNVCQKQNMPFINS